MQILRWSFTVEGIAPGVLMSNPANMGGGAASAKAKRGKSIPTPEEEAASRVYKNQKGELYIPSVWIRSSLLRAGTGSKIGKTAAATLLSASLFIEEGEFTLLGKGGRGIKKYEIDTRRAVVQRNGVLRSRPLVPQWRVNGFFDYDAELIKHEQLREFLEIAGRLVGIGDYRPEKRGWFGRFVVVSSESS